MEMLFPPHCLFCGELKPFRSECPTCISLEEKFRLSRDMRLDFQRKNKTADHLSKTVTSYLYSGETADMVARYKFKHNYSMALEMAKRMGSDVLDLLGEDCCDYVMAVPAHKKSTNQHSLLIAKRISKILSIPYLADVLVKTKATKPQHELSSEERAKNLKGAFSVMKPEVIKGKRILLCDDVMTSGNTLNECAKSLLESGAKEVFGAVFSATAGQATGENKKISENA